MSRLMSVSLTEDAVRARRKTVTRRLGWAMVKPGDTLTLCRKVMGRKRADGTVEPLVRIAEVRVVSVRREPLNAITDDDVIREGFDAEHRGPLMLNDTGQPFTPAQWFVEFFTSNMKCKPDAEVTRIEWEYLHRRIEGVTPYSLGLMTGADAAHGVHPIESVGPAGTAAVAP